MCHNVKEKSIICTISHKNTKESESLPRVFAFGSIATVENIVASDTVTVAAVVELLIMTGSGLASKNFSRAEPSIKLITAKVPKKRKNDDDTCTD